MPSASLTPGQRAQLEALLVQQLHQVEQAMAAQREGADTRAEYAQQILSNDPDAPREHEGEREVQLERADRLAVEQQEIGDALLRLRREDGRFGACTACGADIPFDRLRAQPMAARCVGCQERAEA